MVARHASEQQAIAYFLKTGEPGSYSIPEIIALCDKHVRTTTQSSIIEALPLAQSFVKQSRKLGSDAYLAALRAAGWTFLVAGKYHDARRSYLAARALVVKQPLMRARIDRTLIDVYMYLGDAGSARQSALKASTTFRRLRAEDDFARTQVNYANLLHRQDRHRQAYKLYHAAAEHFQRRGDALSTALCWYNEANTLVQLFDFDAAYKLYSEARSIFLEKDHALHAYGCLYGLAWLHMLKGDFHIALRDLASCEAFYRQGGQRRELVLCLLDRAESYLGLNLLPDAIRTAAQAAIGARKLGIRYEEAKAAFFSARAAIGMNRQQTARAQLRLARRLMSREQNQAFLTAIEVTAAMLGKNDQLRRRAIDVARSRSRALQLPLWEAICDVEIAATRPDNSAVLKRLDHNRAVQTVPHLSAQYGVLRGDQEAARGRLASATRWWGRSAEILDAVRSVLPPIELRSAFLQGRHDPFHRLIAAESARDPRRAALWLERSKNVGIWSPLDRRLAENPDRIRVQSSMGELARQVAAVAAVTAAASGRRSARLAFRLPQLAKLREQIRQQLLELYAGLEGGQPAQAFTLDMLLAAADELPIIQFHFNDFDIQAIITHRGNCRVHTYPDGVRVLDDFVARWRFFTECAPSNTAEHRAVDLSDEAALINRISAWLLEPLELSVDFERILLVPEGKLFCLPWTALIWRGEPIYRNLGLLQAPSVRHFLHSRRAVTRSNRAHIFVGETAGLPWIKEELELIQRRFSGMSLELHQPCRRTDFPDHSAARIWHYAGHAILRSDNPFYSALLLDQDQLFAADLRLLQNDVEVTSLAACRTGQQTGLPGEETSGLVRALLEMGARSVVAGGWAVADRSAALWMDAFYTALMRDQTPLQAMNHAIDTVRDEFPSAFHWAAFAVHGAG